MSSMKSVPPSDARTLPAGCAALSLDSGRRRLRRCVRAGSGLDRDKGARPARAAGVDETGDDFLARAVIATDQNAGAGVGSLSDALEDHTHGGVVADEARPAGSFAQGVAGLVLQYARDDPNRQVMVERPGQKLVRACAKSRDHFSGRALASHGHNRYPRLTCLRGGYHLRSTVGEVHVDDAEIERLRAQPGARRLDGGSHDAFALQRRGDVLEGCLSDRIGVNQKEPLWHAFSQVSAEEIRG